MTQKLHRAEFVTNLQLEQDAIKDFIDILKQEQNALVDGRVEDLDFFASHKTELIKKLSDYADKRDQYLIEKGLNLNPQVIHNFFITEENVVEIGAIWTELLRLTKIVQQLNQINGTIITTRLQQTQQALSALQNAAGTVSLYNPKGQTMGITS
ncbi:MAG: flagellar protein FlgN [Nitrosomonas sp.]|nr:flagellar protein FlgN [Nitrosomonas sp.]